MQNDDFGQGDAAPMSAAVPPSVSSEELAQFEQFKRLKRVEKARARIAKTECDMLSPAAGRAELKSLCREAGRVALGGIVVLPAYVSPCVAYLGDDPSCSLIAAVSHPHGGDALEGKMAAVKRAVKDGADEVEVCAPYFAVRDGNMAYFRRECKKLKKAAKPRALRVVLDCALLSESDVVRACNVAAESGANAVRLVNVPALSFVASAKSALRDRCLLKADAAGTAAMDEAEALGVSLVNCPEAVGVCSELLAEANR